MIYALVFVLLLRYQRNATSKFVRHQYMVGESKNVNFVVYFYNSYIRFLILPRDYFRKYLPLLVTFKRAFHRSYTDFTKRISHGYCDKETELLINHID